MKVPYRWMKDYIETDLSPEALAAEMVLTGNGVEGIIPPNENIKNVVVGRVLEIRKHENADTLFVCSVDAGGEEPVQIVTGAKNVGKGDLVPVALHDSHLPNVCAYKEKQTPGVWNPAGCSVRAKSCLLKEIRMAGRRFAWHINPARGHARTGYARSIDAGRYRDRF